MQTVDLLVTNARLPKPGAAPGTDIAVQGTDILEIGAGLAQKYTAAQTLGAGGKYVFPGFVNTHNHLFQVLTKGLGKGLLLWDWLNTTIFKMTPHIDEEALYWSALAGCMASLRTGVTTTLDFQYLHSHPGQFDAVVQAYEDSGMRGYVGRSQYFSDYEGLAKTKFETEDEYYKNLSGIVSRLKDRSLVDAAIVVPIIIGLRELPHYRDGYLGRLHACAEDLGIPYTAHVVETPDDDNYALEHLGMSTIDFMEKDNFFGPRCVLAHCVKMKESDFAIFKARDVKVSYNPVSNMILASGVAPITRFLDEGICVSVATDGPGSNDALDMLEVLKTGSLLQKVATLDSCALNAETMLDMATAGGARALCRDDIGALAPGKKADFFLFDQHALHTAPVADPVSSLVYTASESSIDTVVVNGRVRIRGGQFADLDEAAVVEKLEAAATRVRKASGMAF